MFHLGPHIGLEFLGLSGRMAMCQSTPVASGRLTMGTVGDAYDNAMTESFFASLECELIARRNWKTKTEARMAVFTWIESWYNPQPTALRPEIPLTQ